MHWTQEQYEEHILKFKKPIQQNKDDISDEGPESNLQKKIVEWAEIKGYPCLSFRQSKKAKGFLTPGWPDVSLALPGNRTVWIELKSESGVLRDKQRKLQLMFLALGHEWYLVKSYKKFLQIIENKRD